MQSNSPQDHYLFLLLIQLSQLKDRHLVLRIFTQAMEAMWPGLTLKWADGPETPDEPCLSVRTLSGNYGRILTKGSESQLPAQDRQLLGNAVNMLALLLERLDHKQQLESRKAELEGDVLSRTSELRDSEERYRALFAAVSDPVLVADRDTGILVECNEAAERFFGRSREQLIGRPQSVLHPPHTRLVNGVTEDFKRKVTDPRGLEEIKLLASDGDVRDAEVTASVFDIGDNKLVLGVFRDITERKRAEEELRRREKDLMESQRFAHVGNWRLDIVTNEVEWSEELYKMFGYDPALPPPPYTEHMKLFTPESWELLFPALTRTKEKGIPYEFELEMLKKNGDSGWMWVRGEPILDSKGSIVGLWGAAQDITERKRVQDELRKTKEMLAADLQVMTKLQALSSQHMDEGGLPSLLENALDTAIGISEADMGNIQLLNTKSNCLEIVAHRGFQKPFLDFWNSVQEGQGACGSSMACGERILVEDVMTSPIFAGKPALDIQLEAGVRAVQSTPLINRAGKVLGAFSTHYREPQKWNSQRLRYLDLLTRQISDMVDQELSRQILCQSKVEAESASKSKSEFLANMSHEIRTPLNGILGMLQLMGTTALDEEQKEYILRAIKSSTRLTRLLSDILDLSKIEAGKLSIYESVFEMASLKQSVLELFELAANEQQIDLDFNVSDDMPQWLVGDETRLRQILFNLVGNAIKFSPHGRVTIDASPLPSSVGSQLRVLLTVSDTGIGIADDVLESIFEPFTQAEGAYTRRFQGAGLGLAIVRKLVAMLGGELAIDNTEGAGTTVYLSLPFRLTANSQGIVEQTFRGVILRPEKILQVLLVDDDEVSLTTARKMLEKFGYVVETAGDGQEVLNMLGRRAFDLILMDVQMPVLDGVEATMRIRGSEAGSSNKDIPIIAMTAYAMSGDKEKFLAAGMDDYISKPLDMAELEAVIRRVMEKWAPEEYSRLRGDRLG